MQNASPAWFVDFKDVWLAYNDELLAQNHFAVEAIDLTVRQGEFIAIVGPSGCGKSTFMKLTTGLKMPSKGRILIDQQPVTGPLKISGMAFQAPSLLPWRTTLDNASWMVPSCSIDFCFATYMNNSFLSLRASSIFLSGPRGLPPYAQNELMAFCRLSGSSIRPFPEPHSWCPG